MFKKTKLGYNYVASTYTSKLNGHRTGLGVSQKVSDKLSNIKVNSVDVARLAGVSRATVSYVLNQRQDQTIREETRRRVLDAVQTLGYSPHLAARTLKTGKTGMIELWVPSTYHSVFNHVAEQITQLAQESGQHVIVVHIRAETRESLASAGLLSGRNMDAVLAFDARDLINDILDADPHTPPIISLGPAYSSRTDHVGVDLHKGVLQAVRHLCLSGCRRIASAGLQTRLTAGDPRYDAYTHAIQGAGLSPEFIPLEQCDYEHGYRAVREYFDSANHPDALFCWNDETAIGANRALAELGLHVPEDVALMGVDGTRETAYVVPPISTVAQPFAGMCHLAWSFLQRRLQEPDLPLQGAVLPMSLEVRASTSAHK
jgi:LacI family transcriptional regulator